MQVKTPINTRIQPAAKRLSALPHTQAGSIPSFEKTFDQKSIDKLPNNLKDKLTNFRQAWETAKKDPQFTRPLGKDNISNEQSFMKTIERDVSSLNEAMKNLGNPPFPKDIEQAILNYEETLEATIEKLNKASSDKDGLKTLEAHEITGIIHRETTKLTEIID